MVSILKNYGEYLVNNINYSVYTYNYDKGCIWILANNNSIVSAYKKDAEYNEFCYSNKLAKDAYDYVQKGLKLCSSKNVSAMPCELGVCNRHAFDKFGSSFTIELFDGKLFGCEIVAEDSYLVLKYNDSIEIPVDKIPWTQLTTNNPNKRPKRNNTSSNTNSSNVQSDSEFMTANESIEEDVPVRSLEEVALMKDLSWLNIKKYYVVNEEIAAEKIFRAIEEYIQRCNGFIGYDVETSGLFINMFGKIGSKENKQIREINAKIKEEGGQEYRVDSLTGLILCIQKHVSYYFPAKHKKFRNLYDKLKDGTFNEATQSTIDWILSKYTVGEYRDRTDDMANYLRSTPPSEWGSDVILMERLRYILEQGHLCAHNGIMEWKTTWLYNISINLKEDSMVMHKMMYKFRSTTINSGERSDLKYLSGKDLPEQNINQLELHDFFIGYKDDSEDKTIRNVSETRKKKSSSRSNKDKVRIDFSYMTYEGAKAYAPADGDVTLQLCVKYKSDMREHYANMEYLYNIEIIVSCAIAYMEFYGIRIDENKINRVKLDTQAEQILLEHEMRKFIKYTSVDEDNMADIIKLKHEGIKKLASEMDKLEKDDTEESKQKIQSLYEEYEQRVNERSELSYKLKEIIDTSDKYINFGSPPQVAKLFFVDLRYDDSLEKPSVGKNVIKKYVKAKDEKGEWKYPLVRMYSDWKNMSTLLSKFFDNLGDYMYPGGFIFASYGQISTATGRMSCSKPNNQQYPKSITAIVVPREDCVMIDADFSQIEYRTMVAMAHELGLLEKFKDPDVDYHTMMASLMFGVPYAMVTPKMRGDAKSFNFGIPYGMGFKSLAILLVGVATSASIEDAKIKYELYFKDQPNVRQFFIDVKEDAKLKGFTETLWHRRREYSFIGANGEFDNNKLQMALRQAGNAVIQGTAADIFKIAVARTFTFIKRNNLYGKFFICNMVHDEQLSECNCKELDVQVILKKFIECMEFEIPGFPPLFVGAGVGLSWKDAKGKMAEIHPHLASQLMNEVEGKGIYAEQPKKPREVLDYFNKRVFDFRVNKVKDYVTNEDNWNQALHPAIGNLLSLQFDYGVTQAFEKEYVEEKYSKTEIEKEKSLIPLKQLSKFFEEYNLELNPNLFSVDNLDTDQTDEEDEEGYDEMSEDEVADDEFERLETEFALLDESDELYGIDIRDVIRQFSMCVDLKNKICGIDVSGSSPVTKKKLEELADYLDKHQCNKDDAGAIQIVYLKDNNVLYHTGVYVKDISGSRMSAILKISKCVM